MHKQVQDPLLHMWCAFLVSANLMQHLCQKMATLGFVDIYLVRSVLTVFCDLAFVNNFIQDGVGFVQTYELQLVLTVQRYDRNSGDFIVVACTANKPHKCTLINIFLHFAHFWTFGTFYWMLYIAFLKNSTWWLCDLLLTPRVLDPHSFGQS